MAKRIPVILEDCLDKTLFTEKKAFGDFDFDDILHNLFKLSNNLTQQARPHVRQQVMEIMRSNDYRINYKIASKLGQAIAASEEKPQNDSSWTHTQTPNTGKNEVEQILSMRRAKVIRTFLKLSTIVSNTNCYDRFHDRKTGKLKPGYVQCIILDGLWKPHQIPKDLYTETKYPNDLGWMIFSAKNTGSQLHADPDLMGAWNLLLLGRKWWVVYQTNIPVERITCDESCSPGFEDGSHTWPWFVHVLPQLRDKK